MKNLRPYLFLSLVGLLAFAPVSFMIYALKNDVVALEYPISHFISHSLRNGVWPSWFSSWGMGFPLQSTITWGVFSTPRLLFSGLFDYNIYSLHAEFMFYILLSGWSMFYLLKRFILSDEKISLLLSASYMLSGFMVGSSQWLLYITGAAFIPVLISSVLHLLERPSWRYALQTTVIYTMMFTSVYAAFNIISTYLLVAGLAIYLFREKEHRLLRLKFLFISAGITLFFCLPILIYSLEVISSIDRGNAISQHSEFFHSNYLHPFALRNLLLPLSSIKMQYPNTEGTMLHSYLGLGILILLPLGLYIAIRNKYRLALIVSGISVLFLLAAFGHLTPLRDLLNYLPGFSYFRHAAIFRFYFILFLVISLALSLRSSDLADLIRNKWISRSLIIMLSLAFLALIFTAVPITSCWKGSLQQTIHSISEKELTFLSAILQILLILLLLVTVKKGSARWFTLVLCFDLMLNSLACLPFFGVSSYRPAELNQIFSSVNRFPVQTELPADVPAVLKDPKGNTWQNINVFRQKISSAPSYRGPLELKGPLPGIEGKPIVFAAFDSTAIVSIMTQRPDYVQVKVKAIKPCIITLSQNKFPGWKVRINDSAAQKIICYRSLADNKTYYPPPGISVISPPGETTIEFIYERKEQLIFAIILHTILIGWLIWRMVSGLRTITRSSYLS